MVDTLLKRAFFFCFIYAFYYRNPIMNFIKVHFLFLIRQLIWLKQVGHNSNTWKHFLNHLLHFVDIWDQHCQRLVVYMKIDRKSKTIFVCFCGLLTFGGNSIKDWSWVWQHFKKQIITFQNIKIEEMY